MSRLVAVGVLAVVAMTAACGGGARSGATLERVPDFECRERRMEYLLAGGFVALEAGVSVTCNGDKVTLKTWRVTDKAGTTHTKTHAMSQVEFNELWSKIESAGWRNLGDCDNPDAAEGDPLYVIDIGDIDHNVSLNCHGKGVLPFPYDRLVNELDLKAAGFPQ
jgi:hypothetical protein